MDDWDTGSGGFQNQWAYCKPFIAIPAGMKWLVKLWCIRVGTTAILFAGHIRSDAFSLSSPTFDDCWTLERSWSGPCGVIAQVQMHSHIISLRVGPARKSHKRIGHLSCSEKGLSINQSVSRSVNQSINQSRIYAFLCVYLLVCLCLFVPLCACLCLSMSVYLSVFVSVSVSVSASVCVCLFACQSASLPVTACLNVYLLIMYIFVCLSVCLSVCPSVRLYIIIKYYQSRYARNYVSICWSNPSVIWCVACTCLCILCKLMCVNGGEYSMQHIPRTCN